MADTPDGPPAPGPAPLEVPWLAGTRELHLPRFFAKRDLTTHLVAPDDVARALLAPTPGGVTHSPTLEGVPAAASTVIVADAVDERGLLARARQRWPGRRVWGLLQHVVPLRAADGRPRRWPADDLRIEALRPYAIACLPRSGSTLLCELLAAAGAGRPAEHLRGPLATALSNPGVDPAETWRQVAGHAAHDGCFGTKLVTSFVDDAAAGHGGRWDAVLAPLSDAGLRVLYLRRAPLDVAVSRHVASRAGRYHVRGVMGEEDRARFESVEHDPARLQEMLRRSLDEAERLAAWVAGLPAGRVHEIHYESLAEDPPGTVARALDFLGHAGSAAAVDRAALPLRLSEEVPALRRLRDRFLDELAAQDPALARRALQP